MTRTAAQYLFTFNAQSTKYLQKSDRYIDGFQTGVYLRNKGLISLFFNYCEAAIEFGITDETTPNNVLDKIIVEL